MISTTDNWNLELVHFHMQLNEFSHEGTIWNYQEQLHTLLDQHVVKNFIYKKGYLHSDEGKKKTFPFSRTTKSHSNLKVI